MNILTNLWSHSPICMRLMIALAFNSVLKKWSTESKMTSIGDSEESILLHEIQNGLSSITNYNLGETIPMPSRAQLYNIPVQKFGPFRCLALRTRTGRFKSSFVTPANMCTSGIHELTPTTLCS